MSCANGMSRTSTPPKRIAPSVTSQKPAISLAMVLFPDPEGPTIAVILPGTTVKLKSCSTLVPSW